MQHIPDEATIVSCLHRDDTAQQAFGQLIDLYGKRLYTTIRRWTKNHEDTNDILQEVLLKIWKNKHQFRGESGLFSWIYRIAYNETLHFLKKTQNRHTVDLDLPLVEFQHASEHYGKISSEQITEWLLEAIEQLPEKQRLTFEYRYFDDLSYDEIAALTGVSTGGLKANYFHAAQKIEEFLKARLNH